MITQTVTRIPQNLMGILQTSQEEHGAGLGLFYVMMVGAETCTLDLSLLIVDNRNRNIYQ